MGEVIQVDFSKGRKLVDVPGVGTAPEPASPTAELYLRIFSDLIQQGEVYVSFVVDDNVTLPAHLKKEEICTLKFSHGYRVPDFDYDARGVRGSLLFGQRAIFCDVPWDNVQVIFPTPDGAS